MLNRNGWCIGTRFGRNNTTKKFTKRQIYVNNVIYQYYLIENIKKKLPKTQINTNKPFKNKLEAGVVTIDIQSNQGNPKKLK